MMKTSRVASAVAPAHGGPTSLAIRRTGIAVAIVVACTLQGATIVAAAPKTPYSFAWLTVANNGDYMPTSTCNPAAPVVPPCKTFNSYNQPSVNAGRIVVMRARSRGGDGQQGNVHGIYTRDMAALGPVVRILDRNTAVPQPNNRGESFIEPPSFPRIDIGSNTVATRGNHPPVWKVIEDGEVVEQLGTTGVYANPFGPLVTAASKLGSVAAFSFFEVPDAPGISFDVFPGAPAVTRGHTIVFKGNYTLGVARTGVYYRDLVDAPIPFGSTPLAPAAGTNGVILIANSADTMIPGTTTPFGSTAPPSAAGNNAVFAGFDNEDNPTQGGIYLAPLNGPRPALTTLVAIGEQVPGEKPLTTFNRLGEGVSFDGRFVGFWGAWGTATKTVRLYCPQEGNKDRVAYCNQVLVDPETGEIRGDPDSICDDVGDPNFGIACYQERQVPVNQGIFVYDVVTHALRVVSRTGAGYDDFVYWNYSGMVPGMAEGGEGDDGEPARWRSAAFVAVSGGVHGALADPTFHAAFKARTGAIDPATHAYVAPVDGIYLRKGPGQASIVTVVRSGMDGTLIDPEAIDDTGAPLPVTEMGLERDGFRGDALVVTVTMGSEETGWAGVYLTRVR